MASQDTGYTSEQLRKLEELFVECEYPNRGLRKKWSRDLGMDPHQIKLWFRNRILHKKIEKQRQENDALRVENERIRLENSRMSKRLENYPKCSTCQRNETHEDLLHENMKLKEEHKRVTNIVADLLRNRARQHDDEETDQGFDDINLD